MTTSKFLFIIIQLFFVFIYLIAGQIFGYPEEGEEGKGKQNANNRKPLYIPSRCKENELLYPGDQIDDWICDCRPGHLYHPASDKCYPAFRQGPCPYGNVLVLPLRKVIPECLTNPCKNDGLVPIHSKCYPLGEPGPCPNPELSYVLGVNVTTLEISCIKQSIALLNRMGEDEDNLNDINLDEVPICPKGCKRYVNGTCPKTKN